ncbi:hypothetical protein QBC34DRAFT_273915, partial [Podospora aff. communis PSN243]
TMESAQRPKRKRDMPNFRALPLRRSFLAVLFLLLCSLLVALECVLRKLPQEHDRAGIPNDSPYVPFNPAKKRQEKQTGPEVRARFAPAPAPTPDPDPHPSPDPDPEPSPSPRPPPHHYANTDPITTYITRALRWHGPPDQPFSRTPIFPDHPVRNKCVYDYPGIVITANSSGCRAIIGADYRQPPPPGWRQARWLWNDILFPVGDRCYDSYEEWYNGVGTVDPLDSIFRNEWRAPSNFRNSVARCTWDDGRKEEAAYRTNADPTVGSIVMLYSQYFDPKFVRLRSWESGPSTQVQSGAELSTLYRPEDLRTFERTGYLQEFLITSTATTIVGSRGGLLTKGTAIKPEPHSTPIPQPQQTPPTQSVTSAESQPPVPSQLQATEAPESKPPSQSQTTSETPGNQPPNPGPSQTTETSSPAPESQSLSATTTSPSPLSPSPDADDMPISYVNVPYTPQFETTTQFTYSGKLITSTITSSFTTSMLIGLPPAMVPASLSTQTDASGIPTATITTIPGDPWLVATRTTLTNPANGSPTATITTLAPPTSSLTTLTNFFGLPTTATLFPAFPRIPGAKPADLVLANKRTSYFLVYFLPVLITLSLLAPILWLDAEIKQLLPFRVLSRHPRDRRRGSYPPAEAVLSIRTSGIAARIAGWRALVAHSDAVSALGDALVVAASALVALSGEAIGLKLRGSCLRFDTSACLVTVASFPRPARAVEAVLAVMMVLVLGLAWALESTPTGTAANPSSVAAVCSLLQVAGTVEVMRRLRVRGKKKKKKKKLCGLEGVRLGLGWVEGGPPAENYGLVVVTAGTAGRGHGGGSRLDGREEEEEEEEEGTRGGKVGLHVPTGKRVMQSSFLFFLCGLLTVVLYYENTEYEDPTDSPFEWFMDSGGFGVTMLFVVLGEVVSFGWGHLYFDETAIYSRMARRPQPAEFSVLEPLPTNPISSLWRAVRWKDPLAISIASASLLSKIMPALLSTVPFAPAQTWKVHVICTWTTIGMLITLIIALLIYMRFVKWPQMHLAPDSLAARIYYLCTSSMVKDFSRLSTLNAEQRDRRVKRMARMYRFGLARGVSGERRIAIDYAEGEQGFEMHGLAAFGFGVAG